MTHGQSDIVPELQRAVRAMSAVRPSDGSGKLDGEGRACRAPGARRADLRRPLPAGTRPPRRARRRRRAMPRREPRGTRSLATHDLRVAPG